MPRIVSEQFKEILKNPVTRLVRKEVGGGYILKDLNTGLSEFFHYPLRDIEPAPIRKFSLPDEKEKVK